MAKVRPTNEMLKRLWLNGGSLVTPIWSVVKALVSHDEKWWLNAFFRKFVHCFTRHHTSTAMPNTLK